MLGHQFVEQVQCARVDVVAVTVERQRRCRSGARPGAGTESMTIAKCQIRGSMNMMGDEEAISSLREGVQDYYFTLKVSMLACLKFYILAGRIKWHMYLSGRGCVSDLAIC